MSVVVTRRSSRRHRSLHGASAAPVAAMPVLQDLSLASGGALRLRDAPHPALGLGEADPEPAGPRKGKSHAIGKPTLARAGRTTRVHKVQADGRRDAIRNAMLLYNNAELNPVIWAQMLMFVLSAFLFWTTFLAIEALDRDGEVIWMKVFIKALLMIGGTIAVSLTASALS